MASRRRVSRRSNPRRTPPRDPRTGLFLKRRANTSSHGGFKVGDRVKMSTAAVRAMSPGTKRIFPGAGTATGTVTRFQSPPGEVIVRWSDGYELAIDAHDLVKIQRRANKGGGLSAMEYFKFSRRGPGGREEVLGVWGPFASQAAVQAHADRIGAGWFDPVYGTMDRMRAKRPNPRRAAPGGNRIIYTSTKPLPPILRSVLADMHCKSVAKVGIAPSTDILFGGTLMLVVVCRNGDEILKPLFDDAELAAARQWVKGAASTRFNPRRGRRAKPAMAYRRNCGGR